MPSEPILVVANGIISFFHMANIPLYIFTTSLSIHLLIGCFYILESTNNAAMNIGVPVSFWIPYLYMLEAAASGTGLCEGSFRG